MKRVKFWSQNASGAMVLREGNDPSRVSENAWRTYNKKFIEWSGRGSWYPLDPMVAYQRGVIAMMKAAEKQADHPDTYVVAAGLTMLRNFTKYHVNKVRSAYRELAGRAKVAADSEHEARCEDKGDREWTPDGEKSLDVQAYAEALPSADIHATVRGRRAARGCLLATLPKVSAEASRGFHCFLAAKGNWRRSALLAGMPNSTYCRRFKVWSEEFTRVCAWCW